MLRWIKGDERIPTKIIVMKALFKYPQSLRKIAFPYVH